ncbi:MAG TPA: sigma-70 family RNA polymerase sigma factor [Verrucomicrobiae bacterium]|jgi:RNA polymerase sigma factor (sigma-70 family)
MMTINMIAEAAQNDSDLVGETLSGNRDAFSRIVSRYQSLICSLTYSATGSLGQSEDLAQETFITAWKHLRHLRERDKLRAWLCGIARNRINNFLRREGREPVHKAAELDEVSETHAPEPLPIDHAISREEQAILWRALERLPETYREPLVLFYREHQSIEAVAAQLDLTEDNVKQRLSRGRKLLQEQVLSFVEGALERTNPGKAFTLDVMTALPAAAAAKATAFGAAMAKGGAIKTGAGVLGTILSPFLAFLGIYSSYRMSLDEARTDEERGNIKRLFLKALVITLAMSLVMSGPLFWICRGQSNFDLFGALLVNVVIDIFLLAVTVLAIISSGMRRRHLAETLATECAGNYPPSAYEYRSRWSLLGLPLIHIRIGDRFDIVRPPVKAWIAVGSSHAVGVLFASGGIAIAPVSFGGIAIGLVPYGAMTLGVFAMGAISFGVWSYGGMAIGLQAAGANVIGWESAQGGLAMAHTYALGTIAHALQANTDIAQQFFQQNLFSRIVKTLNRFGFLMMLLWVVPLFLQSQIILRARRRREKASAQASAKAIG